MRPTRQPADHGAHRIFTAASRSEAEAFRAAKREWSRRVLPAITPQAGRAMRAVGAPISPAPANNVVGVGIGEKLVRGQPTGVRAIKFLVKIKYPDAQVDSSSRLPGEVDGLPTDVEEVGELRVMTMPLPDPRRCIRPAPPGSSIGSRGPGAGEITTGTLGALATAGDDLYMLSNNHVLANENQLSPGAPVFQPSLSDGGRPVRDRIGQLARFEALRAGAANRVDCALATPVDPGQVTEAILFIGPPRGVTVAQDDMVVHKFGRTTGYTAGRVTSTDTDVRVPYTIGPLIFEEQIVIRGLNNQPFSAPGDSGALVLERTTQEAVGLLFAGSAVVSIANHIGEVLQVLGVSLR